MDVVSIFLHDSRGKIIYDHYVAEKFSLAKNETHTASNSANINNDIDIVICAPLL